ncbi:uncharacterized protein TNCV_709431 [Trichonephila clavipes]|nr:uncharacterized protein TNCV_709431 [Trichonephila clavipes]
MSGNEVQQWVRKFKIRQSNVHDVELSYRPPIITHDLMQTVKTKIPDNRRFTITTLSLESPDVSRLVVCKIVTDSLNFKKLCSWWVFKLPETEHKEKRFTSSLDFFLFATRKQGMACWVESLLEMKHGYPISHQTQSSSRCNGVTHILSNQGQAKQTQSKCKIMATVFCKPRFVLQLDLRYPTTFKTLIL